MPLFEQGTDGHLEDAREASKRDQGRLALGALEPDDVETAAADLGGQAILSEACGGARSSNPSRNFRRGREQAGRAGRTPH
jgi:hypothetical protein